MRGDREKAIAAGMNDHLPKPFTVIQLQQILERWLPSRGNIAGTTIQATSEPRTQLPQAFDLKLLKKTFGEEMDLVYDLLLTGLDGIDQDMRALADAIETGNIGDALRHAHTLKSTAATFGGAQGSAIARDLEGLIKNDRLAEAAVRHAELSESLAAMRKSAEAWLKSNPT
jgi:HPt (histidine-containing phosphotransfer) domain-containing protein